MYHTIRYKNTAGAQFKARSETLFTASVDYKFDIASDVISTVLADPFSVSSRAGQKQPDPDFLLTFEGGL